MRSRLKISPACPLVLACHVALDQAREGSMGDAKIGTTGRGIGPAYEDKIARRAIRVQDLFYPDRFAAKLKPLLEFHNFVLTQYFKLEAVPFARTLDDTLGLAAQLQPMVADVAALLQEARTRGQSLLFEGAQGALLDIDHGTYPYVTSSNCLRGLRRQPPVGRSFSIVPDRPGLSHPSRHGPFPTGSPRRGAGLASRGTSSARLPAPARCGWLYVPALAGRCS